MKYGPLSLIFKHYKGMSNPKIVQWKLDNHIFCVELNKWRIYAVIMTVSAKTSALWDVTWCTLVKWQESYGEIFCIYPQDRIVST
jgi:hypothetical protein